MTKVIKMTTVKKKSVETFVLRAKQDNKSAVIQFRRERGFTSTAAQLSLRRMRSINKSELFMSRKQHINQSRNLTD